MKRWFMPIVKKGAVLMCCLFTIILGVYLFLFDGLTDLVVGRMHRVANTRIMGPFYRAGGTDEVHVYLLNGEASQRTTKTFPLRSQQRDLPVYGEYVLTGGNLSEFLDIWEDQTPAYGMGAMCHEPAYGFRFLSQGKLRTETALCWHCSNFSFSGFPYGGVEYGFDAKSQAGMKLLAFCDKLLPYRRPQDPNPPAAEGQDRWSLPREMAIHDAVTAFNDHYHKRLANDQVAPLIEEEILAALALASSSGVSPAQKELCTQIFQKRKFSAGTQFTLVTQTLIGPPGAENYYSISSISLTLVSGPLKNAPDSRQESMQKELEHAITFPVRLLKREWKPWLQREE